MGIFVLAMGCPKCGAPVSDTDLACRQCGMSFVPDASAVVQGMAYDHAAIQMQQQQQLQQKQQQGFGGVPPPPPYNPNANYAQNPGVPYNAAPNANANPYGPAGPGGPPYGFQLPGQTGQTSSDASTALIFAIIGFFCLGFIFGFLAVQKATAAKATIALNPGMEGMGIAQAAYYLGWFDVLVWVLWMFRMFYGATHMYSH